MSNHEHTCLRSGCLVDCEKNGCVAATPDRCPVKCPECEILDLMDAMDEAMEES